MNCTRCQETGFLNSENIPPEVLSGGVEAILRWDESTTKITLIRDSLRLMAIPPLLPQVAEKLEQVKGRLGRAAQRIQPNTDCMRCWRVPPSR